MKYGSFCSDSIRVPLHQGILLFYTREQTWRVSAGGLVGRVLDRDVVSFSKTFYLLLNG